MKKNKQRVWDLPVRILHWSLVLTVVAAWFTRSRLGPLHEYLGYGAAAAVSARLAWGFLGGRYARFKQFLRPGRPTWAYFRQVASRHAPRYIGHNPLGGWMVVALMSCVGALTLTGWLYTTDWLWGYGWLANLHAAFGWLLLALIALHVAGVIYTSWEHRENLVSAMVTGKKDVPRPGDFE